MARVPLLAIALLLASVGIVGAVYLKTRHHGSAPASPGTVVQVDRVSQAVAATSSTRSFAFRYAVTVRAGGRSVALTGNGTYDVEHELAAMSMRISGGVPASAAALGSMQLVLDDSNGPVEYLHMAALESRLPAGKSWVKVDFAALGKTAGVDLGKVEQSGTADPARMLSFLRRVSDPTVVGHERVDGASTTHYRAQIDLRRVIAAETDATARASLNRAIELSGVSSYPADAWIDRDGYLRRVQVRIPLGATSSSAGGELTVTEDLSGFGDPVDVIVPPESSVVDVAELTR